MKKKTITLGIFSGTLAIAALLAGPGMNMALADHGGDNGNRGRGSSSTGQIVTPSVPVTSLPGANAISTGSVMTNKNKDNDDENEGNNNTAVLQARIQALETLVQQLDARILVLEKKVGIVDVIAPVISLTKAANIATTATDITWTTDEPATSKVYFSTTTPVNLATATNVASGTLVTSHTTPLSGLTANTTYFYVVESKDAANNTATSPEQSFVTTL